MTLFASSEPIIVFTALNITIVLGLYVMSLSGQLSMATAAMAGIGGYVSAVLTTNFDWAFIAAVLVGASTSAIIGTLLAVMTYRMQDFILKLTTLAFGEAISISALNINYIGGASGFSSIPLYTNSIITICAAALVFYIVWRFDGSRLGLASRAIREDEIAAASNGISILHIRVVGAALGSTIMGLGGALEAHYVLLVNPNDMGFFSSLTFIIFLLFGGMYNIFGPIAGAIVLTALPEVTRAAAEYRYIIYGLVLLLVVLFRPTGIIGPRINGRRTPASTATSSQN